MDSNSPQQRAPNQFFSQNQQLAVDLVPISERGKIEHTEDEIKLYGQIINLDLEGEDQDLWWIAK